MLSALQGAISKGVGALKQAEESVSSIADQAVNKVGDKCLGEDKNDTEPVVPSGQTTIPQSTDRRSGAGRDVYHTQSVGPTGKANPAEGGDGAETADVSQPATPEGANKSGPAS
ncbi:hypothetical protein BC834DRAFT_873136 [Gloeopeniophorella convolvens]|nr:hypothetical protein BC834DRAFT_873136 [Gloeopeniophorella convolvens]